MVKKVFSLLQTSGKTTLALMTFSHILFHAKKQSEEQTRHTTEHKDKLLEAAVHPWQVL